MLELVRLSAGKLGSPVDALCMHSTGFTDQKRTRRPELGPQPLELFTNNFINQLLHADDVN